MTAPINKSNTNCLAIYSDLEIQALGQYIVFLNTE